MKPIFVEWKPAYSVGNLTLDSQHKKLLLLCNQLAANVLVSDSEKADDFHRILHELSEYSRDHFETEEAILKKLRSPDLVAQKEDHLEYTKLIAETTYLSSMSGFVDRLELQKFVSQWWVEHILQKDMVFRELIVSQGTV